MFLQPHIHSYALCGNIAHQAVGRQSIGVGATAGSSWMSSCSVHAAGHCKANAPGRTWRGAYKFSSAVKLPRLSGRLPLKRLAFILLQSGQGHMWDRCPSGVTTRQAASNGVGSE
jgi:hypothetical protein